MTAMNSPGFPTPKSHTNVYKSDVSFILESRDEIMKIFTSPRALEIPRIFFYSQFLERDFSRIVFSVNDLVSMSIKGLIHEMKKVGASSSPVVSLTQCAGGGHCEAADVFVNDIYKMAFLWSDSRGGWMLVVNSFGVPRGGGVSWTDHLGSSRDTSSSK